MNNMDKFKYGPILLASFWVLFSFCMFASAEEPTTPITNVSAQVSVLDQAESTRSPRSIGNIARFLLGGTYVMVQLGHMPPDHPLVKYPKPIQTARSNTQSVLAAVPGMNGAPFAFPMPVHHSGLPIGRPSFGIGPIPVQSVSSMSYAQLMKHQQPPISPMNPLNAQQHPEKWKEMHTPHEQRGSSFPPSPSLPYNYNSDSPDYTSSTYYTTTGPVSSGPHDYGDANYHYPSSSDTVYDGTQSEAGIEQSPKSPGIHYPGHRYNPDTNSYSTPLFSDFTSSPSYSHPVDSSSSHSAHFPYSSQYAQSPSKDYEASFNAEMFVSSDSPERSPNYPSHAPLSNVQLSDPHISEPAVSSSSIYPQQQQPPPPPTTYPSLPPPQHPQQQSNIIRYNDRPPYFQQQQFSFYPQSTLVTPVQIPRITNHDGYTRQPQIQQQQQHSTSLNNFYSTFSNTNSQPNHNNNNNNNNNNNGHISSSYSSQNVSPVNNYQQNNVPPQQSVLQPSGTIPTTIATQTITTTLYAGTNNNNHNNNYNYQPNSGPTSASSTSNYDVSTTLNHYNNNKNRNVSPSQDLGTKNRNPQVHKTTTVTSDKVNYDPSPSSFLLVNPTASINNFPTKYETIPVPPSKSVGDSDKYYSKNPKGKNKSAERSHKKTSKSSSSSRHPHPHQQDKLKNSESYENRNTRPFSSSSKKDYKEVIRTSESGSGSESTEIQVDDDNSSRHRSVEKGKEKRPHPQHQNQQRGNHSNEYQSSSSNTRPHYNPSSSKSKSNKGVKPYYYYSNENNYRKYKGHESNSKHYKTGKTEPPKINYKDFSSSHYFSKGSNSKNPDPRKSYDVAIRKSYDTIRNKEISFNSNSNPYHHKSIKSSYYLPPSSKSSSGGARSSSSSSAHSSSKDQSNHNDEYYYRNGGGKKSKENFADLISDDDFEVIFAKRRLEIVDENNNGNQTKTRGNGQNRITKSSHHANMRPTLTPTFQNHNTQRKSYGKPNNPHSFSLGQAPQNRNRNRNNKYSPPGRVHKNSHDNPKTNKMKFHLNRHQVSSFYRQNPTPQNIHHHHFNQRVNRVKISPPSRDLSSSKKFSYEIMQSKSNPSTSTRVHRAILKSESQEKQLNISNVTLNQSTIDPVLK